MNNKKRPLLSAIGSFLKSFFTENISIKIIALLFAILLWGYVLTIENPEYVKIVRDVEITYTGENSLTAKGLMLVNREIGTTDVSVLCQIGKHSELDASRLSCVVDLSSREISLAEDEDSKVIPLTVETTIQNGYGSIQSVETSTVNVEVAKVSSRNSIPVGIEMKGSIPEGFQVSVPDRVLISVSGMKSLVDAIARGMVTIDLEAFPINDPENLAGTYSGVYPVRFYNSGNVELEDIYNNSGDSYTSEVTVTIRAYKDVEVEPDIRVEDLYSYTYTLSREYVRVFGELEELEKIDSIATEPVTGLSNMEAEKITANLIVPDGVSLAKLDTGTIVVTLTVSDKMETRQFTVPIAIRNLPSGLLLSGEVPTEAEIRVYGTLRKLEAFSSGYVTLIVDLDGYSAGTHAVPIQIELDERTGDLVIELTETMTEISLQEKNPPAAEPAGEPEGE